MDNRFYAMERHCKQSCFVSCEYTIEEQCEQAGKTSQKTKPIDSLVINFATFRIVQ